MRQFFLLMGLTSLLFLGQTSEAVAQTVDNYEYILIHFGVDPKDPRLTVYYPDGKSEDLRYKDVPTGAMQAFEIDRKLTFHLSELINKLGKEGWHFSQSNLYIYVLERKLP